MQAAARDHFGHKSPSRLAEVRALLIHPVANIASAACQTVLESQVDGYGHVQRVGVMDSPSVGNPNALTGVTSYTSNGAPPDVGAP